jgi:hypothetical protein
MVKLDILRQRRAWNKAKKKLTPTERNTVEAYYELTSATGALAAGAGGVMLIDPMSSTPLVAGAALTGVMTPHSSRSVRAIKKFQKLYHSELNKMRKEKLKKVI